MQTVNKSELKRLLGERQGLLLINVLSRENFDRQHIPGSVNIPLKDNAAFAEEVEARAISKNQRIVVYCQSTSCDASRQAAQKLTHAGFTNVQAYEEGVEGWFGQQAA